MAKTFNELLAAQIGNEFAASQQYIAVAAGSNIIAFGVADVKPN